MVSGDLKLALTIPRGSLTEQKFSPIVLGCVLNNRNVYTRLKATECPDATMVDNNPLILERGEGSYVWDLDGKKYIDLCAGFGSLALGHNHKRLKKILENSTLYQGMGDVYASRSKLECLETLKSFLPEDFTHGAFAVTGSQAVELALKTACLYTGGSGVISFTEGYHGLDLGLLPITGREDFRAPFKGLLAKEIVEHVPYNSSNEKLEAALSALKRREVKPACVIAEPILGRGGMILPEEGFLERLSSFCKKNGILLILDEILTGLGRIGTYTSSHEISCDIICLGKILGGGFPISSCFAKKDIMKSWDLGQVESLHTGTFFGHPLMCELSKETLLEIKENSLAEKAKQLGEFLEKSLKEKLSHSKKIKDIRIRGLMGAIEFKEDGLAAKAMFSLRENGLILIPSGKEARTLSMTPALNISKDTLEEAISILTQTLLETL